MKYLNLILAIWLISCNSGTIENSKPNQSKYYKLLKAEGDSYILRQDTVINDTLSAINELLNYKGDTRLISGGVKCFNSSWSIAYNSPQKELSVQVFALHQINMLLSDSLYFNTPYPALLNIKTQELVTVSGESVDYAYSKYEEYIKYYEKTEEIKNPLENGNIKWYRGYQNGKRW